MDAAADDKPIENDKKTNDEEVVDKSKSPTEAATADEKSKNDTGAQNNDENDKKPKEEDGKYIIPPRYRMC